ncbi:hypothetical protein UF64_06910 [Thalassospira sp. HJ]|uniref:hypothetical protein n=1 Tax=Thalassospira sp. HJ TaxID=1616823 RepID=UPI0005CEB491|nr:hypothetical protein [Thalassospira sp. HJ]KJE35837.1 hypothetical protein UF64_06910 [Thalassospira sp. HJ]
MSMTGSLSCENARYIVFDLVIKSDIYLPELTLYDGGREPDVEISISRLYDMPDDAKRVKKYIWHHGDVVHISWPRLGEFQVIDGRHVLMDLKSGVEMSRVRTMLLGTVISVVLYLKQMLVVHASATLVGDKVAFFVGPSGVGKSTMVAYLQTLGFETICDDLCVFRVTENGRVILKEGIPRVKLWTDSLEFVGTSREGLLQDSYRRDKFHDVIETIGDIDVTEGNRFYLITPEDEGDFRCQPLDKLASMIEIQKNLYQPKSAKHFLGHQFALNAVANLLRKNSVFEIYRPTTFARTTEKHRKLIDIVGSAT